MKVLICGSREFDDWSYFTDQMEDLSSELDFDGNQPIRIIEGGAIGADFCARLYAKYCGWDHVQYKADWKKHGNAAGPIRNQQMLDEEKPDIVVAFWDGKSTGTKDMISRAENQNIPVHLYIL